MPTSLGNPVTVLTTPFGNPASAKSSTKARVEQLACSDGLITTVLPAASKGASFHVSSNSGEFHGTMAATTPIGSRRVKANMPGLSIGSTAPSILVRQPAEIAIPFRHVAELSAHLGDQLAVVPCLQRRQPLRIGGDQVGEAQQQFAPARSP